jgi:uncharacterized membrane protein YhaH (DUF805 family)
LLQDDSAGRTDRELWWMNILVFLVIIIPPWFSMLIYHLGKTIGLLVAVVQRCSLTPSTSSSSSNDDDDDDNDTNQDM